MFLLCYDKFLFVPTMVIVLHSTSLRVGLWPELADSIGGRVLTMMFIDGCLECQQANRRQVLAGVNSIPPQTIPVGPLFHRMSVDVMGPLPETLQGNKYVVVFVEYRTRWPEAFAIAKADATTIAMLIKDHIIPRFGAPEILLSDRGSIFISELITTVCASLQIVQVNSTAYHPQANGLVERMNGAIGRLLRRVLASHKNH